MSGLDYDILVIGSGFGGRVTALRLTEKGYRVGVLESGRRFDDPADPVPGQRHGSHISRSNLITPTNSYNAPRANHCGSISCSLGAPPDTHCNRRGNVCGNVCSC